MLSINKIWGIILCLTSHLREMACIKINIRLQLILTQAFTWKYLRLNSLVINSTHFDSIENYKHDINRMRAYVLHSSEDNLTQLIDYRVSIYNPQPWKGPGGRT